MVKGETVRTGSVPREGNRVGQPVVGPPRRVRRLKVEGHRALSLAILHELGAEVGEGDIDSDQLHIYWRLIEEVALD